MATRIILVENLTYEGNEGKTIGNAGKTRCTFIDTMTVPEIINIVASNMNIKSTANLRLEYYNNDFEEFANVDSVDDVKDKDATIKLHYNPVVNNLARVQEEPVTIPQESVRVQEDQAVRNVWDIIATPTNRFENVPDTQPQPVRTEWSGDGNWSNDVSPQVETYAISAPQLWELYKIYIESGKFEDASDVENKLYEHHNIVLYIQPHYELNRWYCTLTGKSGKLSGLEPNYNGKDFPRDQNLQDNIQISKLLITREQLRFTHEYDKSDKMRTDLRTQFKIEVYDPKNEFVTWWFKTNPTVKYILESKYMHHNK